MTMNALAHKLFGWARTQFQDKPLPEPDPINAKARPMRGFFAALTADQKKQALSYRGDENHGDRNFVRS
jgi:hypothetical protein